MSKKTANRLHAPDAEAPENDELADDDLVESRSKMASGGEELRDHDFPISRTQAQRSHGRVMTGTSAATPELVHSGGKVGAMPGDTQRVGEVGAIVDQDTLDPDNFPDR